MEIKKHCKFRRDFAGTQPAIGAEMVVANWITGNENALLSFADQIKKKGETAQDAFANILKIHHRNGDGSPYLGGWMIKRCLICTGQGIFNAKKDPTHPKKDIIAKAIQEVTPVEIFLYRNGNKITKHDYVKTFTTTVRGRSFFSAYEFIRAGAEFDCNIIIDDELLEDWHIDKILSKCGDFGAGGFRERYGQFD